jgi:dTDP-4-dehydrorhamnose reductase
MHGKKILITGASGLLGNEIIKITKQDFEITGWVNSHLYSNPEFNQVKVNLFNETEIYNHLSKHNFDFIIHTAALSNTSYCQQNPEESFQINVKATFAIAQFAALNKIPFVFISTDLVFNGEKGNYSEDDSVAPLNIYAKHKTEAEEKINSIYPEALIVRVPWMLGVSKFSSSGYLKSFISDLRSGKKIFLFTDEFRSAIFASEAAKGIIKVMEKAKGILHLGGTEKLSRYEIGVLLAKHFSLNEKLIQRSALSDNITGVPRPADVTLNSTKSYQLGYSPKTISESLIEFNDGGLLT